jgi:RNA polymerase sigma factor (sigma-70 family)
MPDELDSVTLYLNDLQKVAKLTEPERRALWLQGLQDGEKLVSPSHNMLWQDALRMVPVIDQRLRKAYGIELPDPDMIQEGNLACCRAIETWDPEAGAFTTWVGHVVRGAMLDYLNEANKGGVGSKSATVTMVDMHDSVAFSAEQTGDEDRPGMRGNAGGIPRGDLLTYSGVLMGDDREGAESVPEGYDTPDREAYRVQLRDALDRIVDPLDKKILIAYYGFDGPPRTLAELATELDYSVTGVRKRLLAAQEKVKKFL